MMYSVYPSVPQPGCPQFFQRNTDDISRLKTLTDRATAKPQRSSQDRQQAGLKGARDPDIHPHLRSANKVDAPAFLNHKVRRTR